MKPILLYLFCFLSYTLSPSHADIIHLKDGKKIEADKVWQENGLYKYSKYGSIVGYPIEKVERIEKTKNVKNTDISEFKFDKWILGAKYDQVLKIVQKDKLKLIKQPTAVNTVSDSTVSDSNDEQVPTLSYNESILGKKAIITLFFTPRSKKLTYITIHWNIDFVNNVRFGTYVEKALTKRHGAPTHKTGTSIFTKVLWTIGERDQIILLNGINFLEMSYVDKRMHRLIYEETNSHLPISENYEFKDLHIF